jgi:hypothetical protein
MLNPGHPACSLITTLAVITRPYFDGQGCPHAVVNILGRLWTGVTEFSLLQNTPIQIVSKAHPAVPMVGTGSFRGLEQPRRGTVHPLPSSTEVKEKVDLYVYSPPPFHLCLHGML